MTDNSSKFSFVSPNTISLESFLQKDFGLSFQNDISNFSFVFNQNFEQISSPIPWCENYLNHLHCKVDKKFTQFFYRIIRARLIKIIIFVFFLLITPTPHFSDEGTSFPLLILRAKYVLLITYKLLSQTTAL